MLLSEDMNGQADWQTVRTWLSRADRKEKHRKNNFAREFQPVPGAHRARAAQPGDLAGALNSFSQAAAISAKASDSYLTALAHESMGSLQANQEHYAKALFHYENS